MLGSNHMVIYHIQHLNQEKEHKIPIAFLKKVKLISEVKIIEYSIVAVRPGDEVQFYENNNRLRSLYDKETSKAVEPEHYLNPIKMTKKQIEGTSQSFNKTQKSNPILSASRSAETLFHSANVFQPADNKKGLDMFNKAVSGLKKVSTIENLNGTVADKDSKFNLQSNLNIKTKDILDGNICNALL